MLLRVAGGQVPETEIAAQEEVTLLIQLIVNIGFKCKSFRWQYIGCCVRQSRVRVRPERHLWLWQGRGGG